MSKVAMKLTCVGVAPLEPIDYVVIAFYAQSPQRLHANGLIDAAYLILAACAAGPEAV